MSQADKTTWIENKNLKIQYISNYLGNEKENFPFNVNIQTIKQFHNTIFFLLFNHKYLQTIIILIIILFIIFIFKYYKIYISYLKNKIWRVFEHLSSDSKPRWRWFAKFRCLWTSNPEFRCISMCYAYWEHFNQIAWNLFKILKKFFEAKMQ